MKLTVGSLFAGIGGFDAGFEQAGFSTAWQVEIDPECRRVLGQRFPSAERFEDVTRCGIGNLKRVDVVCGGFPCQDVSVAGRRAGLAGERTGLFYDAARILQELRPTWFVFENVPGLFSSNKGRDFAEVLRVLMVECGYGVCWRVLNSQFFGVAQRRRRVFIVGRRGRPCPAEVLFEPESGRRDSQAGGETGERLAGALGGGARGAGRSSGHHGCSPRGDGSDNIVAATLSSGGTEPGEHLIAYSLRADPGGTGQGHNTSYGCQAPDANRVRSAAGFSDWLDYHEAMNPKGQDSRRYRMLGNAVTVSVARWIAQRILDYERQTA